jgi:hypothetical protein
MAIGLVSKFNTFLTFYFRPYALEVNPCLHYPQVQSSWIPGTPTGKEEGKQLVS